MFIENVPTSKRQGVVRASSGHESSKQTSKGRTSSLCRKKQSGHDGDNGDRDMGHLEQGRDCLGS